MKRILKLDNVKDVIVEINYPELDDETDGHYKLRYTIYGLSKVLTGDSFGIDEIQTVDIALKLIGSRLYSREEFKNGRLRWPLSIESDDLGFPK